MALKLRTTVEFPLDFFLETAKDQLKGHPEITTSKPLNEALKDVEAVHSRIEGSP